MAASEPNMNGRGTLSAEGWYAIPGDVSSTSNELRLPAFREAMRNIDRQPERSHDLIIDVIDGRLYAPGTGPLATRTGETGVQGAVYGGRATDVTVAWLRSVAGRLFARVGGGGGGGGGVMPRVGDDLIIKIDSPRRTDDVDDWLRTKVHEASVHEYLARAPPVRGAGWSTHAKEHVPQFHFAGAFYKVSSGQPGQQGDKGGVTLSFIHVMQRAPGVVLKRLPRGQFDLNVYLRFERATASLWAAGIAHADLHDSNALYDAATNHVWIVDFGFAVVLPDALRDRVRLMLPRAVRDGVRSLGQLFRTPARAQHGVEGLQAYVDSVLLGRDYEEYNPNAQALIRHAKTKTYVRDLTGVAEARRQLWGIPASTPSLTPGSTASTTRNAAGSDPDAWSDARSRPWSDEAPRNSNARAGQSPGNGTLGNGTLGNGTLGNAPCRQPCRAQGKVCNPATKRCRKPGAWQRDLRRQSRGNGTLGNAPCRQPCRAQGKVCNPATKRCRKPGAWQLDGNRRAASGNVTQALAQIERWLKARAQA